jgi:alkaline phosphatase D
MPRKSARFEAPRRQFLKQATLGSLAFTSGIGGILYARRAPAVIAADGERPVTSWGLQIGDVVGDRAIVWSRADRASRFIVEWSLDESFSRSVTLRGPNALEWSDYTARLDLTGLPPDQDVFVRTSFESLDSSSRARSEPLTGRFRTPPAKRRDVRFLWSGDVCGQGWGIDLSFGGMKLFESMRQTQADFFIHSGDSIYADGTLTETVTDTAGHVVWTNAYLDQVPEKTKVAETLREYHRNHLYNRFDTNVQRFSAEIPQIWQWDDHEVTNNWSDSKVLDSRYTEQRVRALAANAARAFLDYSPIRWNSQVESERVYRHIPYSRDLDVFMLDMRSYRGPNSFNRQTQAGADTAFLGAVQLAWLKQKLRESRATWKVIAADMPIGLLVPDGTDAQGRAQFEAIANGDGPVLGREFEIADLLRFMKREDIVNTVWLTADVHYCAAHFYDPNKAQFRDFDPFWEFVAGPAHAGTFGPNALDNTFGPRVVFQKVAPVANAAPSAGFQFFGQVDIDHRSKDMLVALKDINGVSVFSTRLRAKFPHGRSRWEWDDE